MHANTEDGPSGQNREPETTRSTFVDEPWKLIFFLFLLAGAPGIPAIWASRGLSATGKTVLTVLVSLYSLAILVFFGWFLFWAYQHFLELL